MITLKNLRDCTAAYNEFSDFKDEIIGKPIWQKWLEDYSSLYQSIPIFYTNYAVFNRFYFLYDPLLSLNNFLGLNDSSVIALKKLDLVDVNSETELINWLLEYVLIGVSDETMAYYDNDLLEPFYTDYFEVKDFKIHSQDFRNVFQFKTLFD